MFFRTIYHGQTGVLELRTLGPERSDTSNEAERPRKAAARLRDFVLVENGQFDPLRIEKFLNGCEKERLGAFYGVALRTTEALKTRKGTADDCQVLTVLFVDADYKHLGEEETRKRISACELPPSLGVNSGGGQHPYWVLETPFLLQTKNGMKSATSILGRLAKSVADVVDETVSEPARVLRIPGSFNFKKEYGNPRPVVLEQNPDPGAGGYSSHEIEVWLGPEPEHSARETTSKRPFQVILSDQIDASADTVQAEQVWMLLGKEANMRNPKDAERVSEVMQKLGFTRKEKVRVRDEGGNRLQRVCYFRDDVQQQLPEDFTL